MTEPLPPDGADIETTPAPSPSAAEPIVAPSEVAEFVPLDDEPAPATVMPETATQSPPVTTPMEWKMIAAAVWAALATLIAVWLWWTQPPYPSPLENLPDDGVLKPQEAF